MSSFIKAIVFLISYEFFAAAALAGVLWSALAAAVLKLGPWAVMDLVPAKVFLGALLANRLLGLLVEVYKRRRTFLLTVGIISALCGLLLNYAYRFDGTAGPGEGEAFSRFEQVEKGPFGIKPYKGGIGIERISGDPLKLDEEAELKVSFAGDEGPFVLAPGQYRSLSPGLKLGVVSVEAAPRVEITDGLGNVLSSAFVKLKLYPVGSEEYFLMTPLPHRFYLSLTGDEEKPLRLKVLRGKLHLAGKDLALSEKVEFDGFYVSFPEVYRWAVVRVKYSPGDAFIYIGAALAVVGLIIVISRRKSGGK